MGGATSKSGENEALALCSERSRRVRQVVELRFALSAAHLAYVQSLRSFGIALRRFAAVEISGELSLPFSGDDDGDGDGDGEPEKSPSPFSSPSSALPPEGSLSPPPQPPARPALAAPSSSPGEGKSPNWDFFTPGERRRPEEEEKSDLGGEQEREDPSEFITHRAKEFLSSMKDIERGFLRAAECGGEITKMLEANKIRLGCATGKGGSSPAGFLSALQVSCFRKAGGAATIHREPSQRLAKVIAWNRSSSWASSSSALKKNHPAAPAPAESELCADFGVDVCMISGSHSSTLDRLYAWERKLYDEVKASEGIRREYEETCSRLGRRAARDLAGRAVDRARSAAKDLHSQLRVAINSVDSISKRIEVLRDEELFPQLMELMQGWSRMWKAMLECHHAQFITISLAYHARTAAPPAAAASTETRRRAVDHLRSEMEFFGSSFNGWVEAHRAYTEALFAWLHNGILTPPRGLSAARRRTAAFSPRRAGAPPIFVLCRDWLAAAKSLPSDGLSAAVAAAAADLAVWCRRPEVDGNQAPAPAPDSINQADDNNDHQHHLRTGLVRVFDQLSKFSEASLKAYEDLRRAGGAAQAAYAGDRGRALS